MDFDQSPLYQCNSNAKKDDWKSEFHQFQFSLAYEYRSNNDNPLVSLLPFSTRVLNSRNAKSASGIMISNGIFF